MRGTTLIVAAVLAAFPCGQIAAAGGPTIPAPAVGTAVASTLDTVKQRGVLRCGITENGRGLATLDENGRWVGFFPDFCRAVATATSGSTENLEFVNVSVGNRFDALREGAVDLLAEASTWTLGRDAGLKLSFAGLYFFDGQGFLVHTSLHAGHINQLHGASVCVQTATTTVKNLADYDRLNNLGLKILAFETVEGTYAAFFSRQCQIVTDDSSALVSLRFTQAQDPAAYVLLPEIISKEPLSPVVRDDDPAWADIVRWVLFAMIAAEERGAHSGNVERVRDGSDPEMRRLLGREPGLGAVLGLDEDWGFRIIRDVGNYGEIFDRNLGQGSPLKLERGYNALWTKGGLLWAPPVR
ncbi:MAG: transporter substrate-binding domain-containing protein [Azospirillum sp.]|nr:transporter substrate-binding domain-containing protein [Azospirillum sp.]